MGRVNDHTHETLFFVHKKKKKEKKKEKSRLKLCLVGGEIWMIENKGEIIGLGAIWWGEKSWRIFGKAHTFSPEPIKN